MPPLARTHMLRTVRFSRFVVRSFRSFTLTLTLAYRQCSIDYIRLYRDDTEDSPFLIGTHHSSTSLRARSRRVCFVCACCFGSGKCERQTKQTAHNKHDEYTISQRVCNVHSDDRANRGGLTSQWFVSLSSKWLDRFGIAVFVVGGSQWLDFSNYFHWNERRKLEDNRW